MTTAIANKEPNSGRVQDEFGNAPNIIEKVTGAVKQIVSDHAAIHLGQGFSLSGIFASVGSAATVNYAFKTPTVASGKIIHFKYRELQATANKIRVDFNEAPTNAPTNGTDLVPVNRNRTGTEIASAMQAVKAGMTIDLTGVKVLDTAQFLSGAQRSTDLEWMLKPNTWYIVTMTNSTGAAADINFFDFWYEEDAV